MEKRPAIWRVPAKILNEQSRTTDKGWLPSLEVGRVLTTPRHKKVQCYEMFTEIVGKVSAAAQPVLRPITFKRQALILISYNKTN